MTSLLPPNSTELETTVERAIQTALNVALPNSTLWSPERCPAVVLPYLAWALSVDEWDASWSEGRQREVIAAAIEVQRHKGTPWAVRRWLAVLGYGNATLVERYGAHPRDGSVPRNGTEYYAPADHWAEYRVYLDRPITIAQAARVRAVLQTVAPARCVLNALDYQRALNLYDQTVPRDGTYSRGVA